MKFPPEKLLMSYSKLAKISIQYFGRLNEEFTISWEALISQSLWKFFKKLESYSLQDRVYNFLLWKTTPIGQQLNIYSQLLQLSGAKELFWVDLASIYPSITSIYPISRHCNIEYIYRGEYLWELGSSTSYIHSLCRYTHSNFSIGGVWGGRTLKKKLPVPPISSTAP